MGKKSEFVGQEMTCVVCNRKQMSHPEVESQWRKLGIDDEVFYACPDEFPEDGSNAKEFQQAYELVIACCAREIQMKETGVATIDELELYRSRRRLKEQKRPKGFGGDR